MHVDSFSDVEDTKTIYCNLVELLVFLPQAAWLVSHHARSCPRDLHLHEQCKEQYPWHIAQRLLHQEHRHIYTLLWTHTVMVEFVQHKINDYLILSSEYVKFLTAHSPNKKVRKALGELLAMIQLVKLAQDEA
jgi:hypothetical protein